jgi:MFS family permease
MRPRVIGILAKQRIVVGAGYNRWLVPPAGLAIHLSIGMAYGFSVFWLPLSKAVGISAPRECPAQLGFFARLVVADCDWKISTLGWMYTLFFVFLGSSAATFGRWVERAGPRKTGVVAALCWGGGFLVSALGLHLHQLWLLWLGSGVIGGCGLGLGYISPVSTLIKWFPDRRGLATGMAIAGFGGGALIGSPLANALMNHWKSATSVGVEQTFLALGLLYLLVMLAGAFGYRLPAPDWTPPGWVPPAAKMSTLQHVHVGKAWRTPQFWLLWTVLCTNVSAGIGLIGMASPMLQEIFGGRLIGLPGTLAQLSADERGRVATVGASFAALISLFNIAGRLGWSALSDALGRKRTYVVFFALGAVLYALTPTAGRAAAPWGFIALVCAIISMYGGGFSTIPAYLADLFGTQHVGAIHGRLLTAWSAAGVLGPVLVNYLREYQLAHGLAYAQAYNTTLYLFSGLLLVGLAAALLVRPVNPSLYMTEPELADERRRSH